MKKSIVLVMILTLVMAIPSFAFDGQRRGFVIGGGLGFAPISRWSLADDRYTLGGKSSESRPGIGVNFLLGYAFDNQNMVVYEGNATGYSSKLNDQAATQGVESFAWYHYFGATGKSAFTTVGLGIYTFDVDHVSDFSSGVGFLVGGGYEFARHWQVGAYVGVGRTSQGGADLNHLHLNLLISTVAF